MSVFDRAHAIAGVSVLGVMLSVSSVACGASIVTTPGDMFPSPQTNWTISPRGIDAVDIPAIAAESVTRALALEIHDGKTGSPLRPIGRPAIQPTDDENTVQFRGRYHGGVHVQHKIRFVDDAVRWRMTISNNGQEEAWVQIAWKAPLDAEHELHFYDGMVPHVYGGEPLKHDEINNTFPVAAVWNESTGLATGVHPDSLVSYIAAELGPDEDGGLFYRYGTRHAVRPGTSTEVEYVIFAFRPHQAHLDAVDGYMQRFRGAFTARKNLDPRVASFGADTLGQGRLWHWMFADEAKWQIERGQMILSGLGSWDWGYAPFRRAGDWYGRAEFWHWEMDQAERDRIERRNETFMMRTQDLEQFHEDRTHIWDNANYRFNTAIGFYVINWLEENLLEDMGKLDQTYKYVNNRSRLNWITTTSFERHVFPWASAYEQTIRRDARDLIETLGLSAFALDNASNDSSYRGELDYDIPGWAYDEEGRFITTGIGHRMLLDYLSSFENRDGFNIAIMANAGSPYMVPAAVDLHLTEARGTPIELMERWPAARYLRGEKALHIHRAAGFINPALDVPWREMSVQEIRAFYQVTLNLYLIDCWLSGSLPSVSHALARPGVRQEMLRMLDLMALRGFRAAPGVVSSPELVAARYGLDLHTAIVLGNKNHTLREGRVEVPSGYVRNGIVLPVAEREGGITFDSSAQAVHLDVSLRPSMYEVIEFPAALADVPGDAWPTISGQGRSERHLDRLVYTIDFQLDTPTEARLLAKAPPEFELTSITLDGRSVQSGQMIALQDAHTLRIEAASKYFKASPAQLKAFPLEDARIVPRQTDRRTAGAMQMIQDFLIFNETSDLASVLDHTIEDPQLHLLVDETQPPGIWIREDATRLEIVGATPFDVQMLTNRLLRWARGERNPWFGHMRINSVGHVQPTRDMLWTPGVLTNEIFLPEPIDQDEYPREWFPQEEEVESDVVDRVTEIDVPVVEQAPEFDLAFDESQWERATQIGDFMRHGEGSREVSATQVWLLFTEESLWVRIEAKDDNPSLVASTAVPRDSDQIWRVHDHIEMFLAPGFPPNEPNFPYYQLLVNAAGSQWDSYQQNRDWQGQWRAEGARTDTGWHAIVEIPLDMMYNGKEADTWRVNFARFVPYRSEWSTWADVRGELTGTEFFGTLRRVDPD